MTLRRPPAPGFTLVELMVVITILGGLLLLVPVNLYRFGARSRLENAANTLVAVVGAARSQAILDGYAVHLEVGTWKTKDDVVNHGYRWVITNQPVERSEALDAQDGQVQEERAPAAEREWITTEWNAFPNGVQIASVSEEAGAWQKLRGDRPYRVTFAPDGGVEKAFAVRLTSQDLEVSEENKTITVLVNGLTAEASTFEGLAEVAPQREENDFVK